MAGPSAVEFASWLRPRDALAKLGVAREAASKKDVVARIVRGHVRIAGQSSTKTGGGREEASQPFLIALDYLHGQWLPEWGDFWSSGQISFVRIPMALEGFAILNIVGPAGSPGQLEIHTFHGVRLDSVAMSREFDLDLTPEKLPAAGKGGRPSGKHGGPMASITLLLSAKSDEELRRYTADSLSLELIEEYRKEGLDPPSETNAVRDAAGILRKVRR